jgi:uncharacterized protein
LVTEAASSPSAHTGATLAPRWHTAALIALQLTVALSGTLLAHYAPATSGAELRSVAPVSRIYVQYLPLLLVNWALVGYCSRLFRPRNALPALLGEPWRSVRRACTDLALALAAGLVIRALEVAASHLRPGRNAAIASLLPSTGAERLTWALVAVSVGFCEEVVYRGYLQSQLTAFTRSRALGVALQAALFGVAHLEQGPAAALRIAVYGLGFGVLADCRRSLLPGIACHIGIDLASGLWH